MLHSQQTNRRAIRMLAVGAIALISTGTIWAQRGYDPRGYDPRGYDPRAYDRYGSPGYGYAGQVQQRRAT